MGNDFIAGAWIFCVIGMSATLAVFAFVCLDPTSLIAWIFFLSTAPFGIGAVLFVRSSYPETMNSSICAGPLAYDEQDHIDAGWLPPEGQKAPLLPKKAGSMV